MVAIKNMKELPKSCFDCPLKTVENDMSNDTYYYCPITGKSISGSKRFKIRDKDCELIEIKEQDKTEPTTTYKGKPLKYSDNGLVNKLKGNNDKNG